MPTNEQHTNREAVDESKRVLTLVTDPGNQRGLEKWQTAHDQYTLVETPDIAEATFDCCLLDRKQLDKHRSKLLNRKESEQIILPYLLLVPESRHREIRNRLRDEHPELWDAIDGLIDMPLAENQLSEQLETFLRLRDHPIVAYNQCTHLQQIRNQHAGHGVSVTDTDGTIEYVNEGFEYQSGYTSEEVVGTNPRIFKSGEHDEAFYEELWNTITAGDVWDGTVVSSRKDGNRYVIEQTIAPVESPDGEITQFIAVNHEITELRELEESLRQQREQLDVLNRVLRDDIRNDMNVVVAWGEMLEDEVTPTGQEKLESILRAGRHVVELTNVARDLSEIIHGDGTPDLKPIPLRQLLSEELEKRRETFANAEITMADPPDQSTHVLANELLSSVFRNLVNNAVQHNHTAQPKVMISVEEADESVRIRVADNGPGISDDVKESLFREGKKGLESGGTGMELFLVGSLVESYGGDVWIEDRAESELFDNPNKADPAGAVFIIELRTTAKQDKIDGGRE